MAVFSRQGLITELLDRTELIKAGSAAFLRLTDEQLSFSPGPGSWSIVEVFAHLNLSNEIYIRYILPKVTLGPDRPSDEFKSSWLGDWAYERIVPRADGSIFKMKTAKSVLPVKPKEDYKEVLHNFHRACDAMDDILRHSATKRPPPYPHPLSFHSLTPFQPRRDVAVHHRPQRAASPAGAATSAGRYLIFPGVFWLFPSLPQYTVPIFFTSSRSRSLRCRAVSSRTRISASACTLVMS